MTTYSKETALYDTGAIAGDISTAGQTASKYITYVDADTGIRVHNANDTDNYLQLNATGSELFRDGTSVAKFGETARVGADETDRVEISAGEFAVYAATGARPLYSSVTGTSVTRKTPLHWFNQTMFSVASKRPSGDTYTTTADLNQISNGSTFYINIESQRESGMLPVTDGWARYTYDAVDAWEVDFTKSTSSTAVTKSKTMLFPKHYGSGYVVTEYTNITVTVSYKGSDSTITVSVAFATGGSSTASGRVRVINATSNTTYLISATSIDGVFQISCDSTLNTGIADDDLYATLTTLGWNTTPVIV
jgi:hypothetical protein